jgi:hypothetical protein
MMAKGLLDLQTLIDRANPSIKERGGEMPSRGLLDMARYTDWSDQQLANRSARWGERDRFQGVEGFEAYDPAEMQRQAWLRQMMALGQGQGSPVAALHAAEGRGGMGGQAKGGGGGGNGSGGARNGRGTGPVGGLRNAMWLPTGIKPDRMDNVIGGQFDRAMAKLPTWKPSK